MYLQEKIIDGVLHYRTRPDDEFVPYTLKDMAGKYEEGSRGNYSPERRAQGPIAGNGRN